MLIVQKKKSVKKSVLSVFSVLDIDMLEIVLLYLYIV